MHTSNWGVWEDHPPEIILTYNILSFHLYRKVEHPVYFFDMYIKETRLFTYTLEAKTVEQAKIEALKYAFGEFRSYTNLIEILIGKMS